MKNLVLLTVSLCMVMIGQAQISEYTVSTAKHVDRTNKLLNVSSDAITQSGNNNAILEPKSLISEHKSITQIAAFSRTITITAGGLSNALTTTEKSTVTNLTILGTIDARDFVTMRDSMPVLSDLDLTGSQIKSYTGTNGTEGSDKNYTYDENFIPRYAFTYILKNNTDTGKSLTSISLPASVTGIGKAAFSFCNGLSEFHISSTLTDIQDNAFTGCSALMTVDISNPVFSSLDGVLFDKNKVILIHYPNSTAKYYNIPASVTTLWNDSFSGCTNLTFITIPSTVSSIHDFAFAGCTGLIAIAVYNKLPINLSTSSFVFLNVNKSTCTIYVPWECASYYKNADQWKDFVSISDAIATADCKVDLTTSGTLAHTLKLVNLKKVFQLTISGAIDAYDFVIMRDSMSALTALDLSNATIAHYTGTSGTDTIHMKKTYDANAIPQCAFWNPNNHHALNLSAIALPTSITKIGDFAFLGLNNLTSITIPATVTSIGAYAFDSCTSLTSIKIPSSVATIGTKAFYSCLGPISVDTNNPDFSSIDGILFNKQQTKLIQATLSKTGSYTIPSTVTSIGHGAFGRCTGLTSITIPSCMDTIGSYAFYYCAGLTTIGIPSSVTSIGDYAFGYCSGLKSIYAYPVTPIDLSSSLNVFNGVNTGTCVLYAPLNSLSAYMNAIVWKDFSNMIAMTNTSVQTNFVDAINLYPNPVKDGFQLNDMKGTGILTLLDLNGTILLSKQIQGNEYISVSNFPEGMYIVKLVTSEGTFKGKVIKI